LPLKPLFIVFVSLLATFHLSKRAAKGIWIFPAEKEASCSLKGGVDQRSGVINRSVSNRNDTDRIYSRRRDPGSREPQHHNFAQPPKPTKLLFSCVGRINGYHIGEISRSGKQRKASSVMDWQRSSHERFFFRLGGNRSYQRSGMGALTHSTNDGQNQLFLVFTVVGFQ